jgi:hypothetical protein
VACLIWAGPRFTWAAFLQTLSVTHLVWVPAAMIRATGSTFVELPLYRPDNGARSSLMHVSNARARATGLPLTTPDATADMMRGWIDG